MSLSDGDDMVYQYSYKYGFYPDKEIYDLVDKFIKNARELPAKRVIETKREIALTKFVTISTERELPNSINKTWTDSMNFSSTRACTARR